MSLNIICKAHGVSEIRGSWPTPRSRGMNVIAGTLLPVWSNVGHRRWSAGYSYYAQLTARRKNVDHSAYTSMLSSNRKRRSYKFHLKSSNVVLNISDARAPCTFYRCLYIIRPTEKCECYNRKPNAVDLRIFGYS